MTKNSRPTKEINMIKDYVMQFGYIGKDVYKAVSNAMIYKGEVKMVIKNEDK